MRDRVIKLRQGYDSEQQIQRHIGSGSGIALVHGINFLADIPAQFFR